MDPSEERGGRTDRGSAMIAAALLGAALILSWGIGDEGPRYQLAGSGSSVVRMDTDSGEMIACTSNGCTEIRAPDRARTFGPLTVELDDRRREGEAQRPVEQLPEQR